VVVRRYTRATHTGFAAAWIAATAVTVAPAQHIAIDHRSWQASHLALAGAFAVALWIDATQTREAVRRGYEELNPVLGAHPSVGRVNTYTAMAALYVLGAAAVAPPRLRRWLLCGALAVEAWAIHSNARAGLAVKFP